MSYARRSRFAGRSNEGRSILGGVSAAFQTVNSAARAAADKATAAAVAQDLDDELDLSFSEPTPSKLPVRKFGGAVPSAVNTAAAPARKAGRAPSGRGAAAKATKAKPSTTQTKQKKASQVATKTRGTTRVSRRRRSSVDSATASATQCASPSGVVQLSAAAAVPSEPHLPSPGSVSSAVSKRDSTGSVLSVASFLSCGSMGQLVTQEEEEPPALAPAPTVDTPVGQAARTRVSTGSSASSSGSVTTASPGSLGSLGSPVDVLATAADSMAAGDSKRALQRSRLSILRAPPAQAAAQRPSTGAGTTARASVGGGHRASVGGGHRASLSSSALRRLSVGMTAHVRHATAHGPGVSGSAGAAGRVSVGGVTGGSGGARFPPPMPGAVALPGMAAAAAAAAARRHSAVPAAALAVGGGGGGTHGGAGSAGFVGRIARRLSVGTTAHLPGGRLSVGGGGRRGSVFRPLPPAPAVIAEDDEAEEDEEGDTAPEGGVQGGVTPPHEDAPALVPETHDDSGADSAAASDDEGAAAAASGAEAGVNWMLLDAHMSLVMGSVFEWVPDGALLGAVGAVSHEWRRLATDAYSWRAADLAVVPAGTQDSLQVQSEEGDEVSFALGAQLLAPWAGFRDAFPWARFLAEGGFKKVYGVYFAPAGRLEAVSVMDMAGVVASGQAEMVRAEVLTGCMVSQLARTGVTPGFVETYQVIPVQHAPPAALWGSPERKTPQGAYQLVRMELCRGGDVEEHLRGVEEQVAARYACSDAAAVAAAAAHDALAIAQSLFGVLQALCAAADRISMRHYDLKLLNILLKPASDLAAEAAPGAAELVHRYSTPQGRVAQLHMPCEAAEDTLSPCRLEGLVPKLVDFGTADMETHTLGQPVTLDHFTTFENVAPEMYWAGDEAQQGYALDVWSLGLCLLHMLTGAMPYEETMGGVTCPPPLRAALLAVWGGAHWAAPGRPARGKRQPKRRGAGPSYAVLQSCLEFDEDGVMPDTLWRAVVLCGLPSATDDWAAPDNNPVWLLLRGYCGDTSVLDTSAAQAVMPKGSAKNSTLPKPRRTRGRPRKCPQPEPLSRDDRMETLFPGCTEVAAAFHSAREAFSLQSGTHPLMGRARARMDALPPLRELLLAMLRWEPAERITYTHALRSDAFAWMQEPRTRRAHRSAASVPMRMRPVKHTQLAASAALGDVLVEDYTALAW